MFIGKNILRYRKEKGLTQAKLGALLGVTYQAVSKWERGKTMPDLFLLPRLADVFGCTIDDLFDYKPKA
jgi:transcriptional regulator with XRE-family HTH domain